MENDSAPKAVEQAEKIYNEIMDFVDFVRFEFGWGDFEIATFGKHNPATIWVGCVIDEHENVYISDEGLVYKVYPKTREHFCFVKFKCEVGLLTGIFVEYVVVFREDFWIMFRRLDEK